jgi:regulator of protease activity HflC (stomatin/prohibitin superfamily)
MTAFTVLVVLVLVVLLLAASGVRLVQQYERALVLRFGRLLPHIRTPGLQFIIPFADRMTKVSMQTVVMGVPAQGAITRDNVTLTVDAVVYFRVIDPVKAVINVQNYPQAVSQVAQTSLRSVIGRADLDTLLSDRERINEELKAVIDAPTEEPWGLHIERVEIKDVSLPEGMKRSMSRQAEAERERRARVIAADGEFQASTKLAQAAHAMADTPGALQLRLLQTVVDVAAEKNSTLVMPFPVELLRFFDHAAAGLGHLAAATGDREPDEPVPSGSGAPTPVTPEPVARPAPAEIQTTRGVPIAAPTTVAVPVPPNGQVPPVTPTVQPQLPDE